MKGDCRIPFGIEDRRPEHSILDLLAPLVREIRIDDSQLTRFDLELDRRLLRLADRSARDGRSNDMAISERRQPPAFVDLDGDRRAFAVDLATVDHSVSDH